MTVDSPERYRQYTSVMALEPYYSAHVAALTDENLYTKSEIAAELAVRDKWRADQDAEIARIKQENEEMADCIQSMRQQRYEKLDDLIETIREA